MPDLNAARNTDGHSCPSFTGNAPHVGGPINTSSTDVLVEDLGAVRAGLDTAICAAGGPDKIAQGSAEVLVNDKNMARHTERTSHAGTIVGHAATVIVGGATVTVVPIKLQAPHIDGGDSRAAGQVDHGASGPESAASEKPGKKAEAATLTNASKPCSIASLAVTCAHKQRTCGPHGVLAVVADPAESGTFSITIPTKNVKAGIEASMNWGGRDTVVSTVCLMDDSLGTRRQTAMTNGYSEPAASEWRDGASMTWTLPSHPDRTLFALGDPIRTTIWGRGCDENVSSVGIDVYPSTQGKFSLSAEKCEAATTSGAKSDAENYFEFGLGIFKVEWEAPTSPTGTVELGWRWEEADDWRAKWTIAGSGGISVPMSVEGSVSLVQIIGVYCGVPYALMNAARELLGDLRLFAKFEFTVTLGLSEVSATLYCDGSRAIDVPIAVGMGGTFTLGAEARAGSRFWAQVVVRGGVSIGVSGDCGGGVNSTGIYVKIGAKLAPWSMFIEVTVEGLFVDDDEYSGNWSQARADVPLLEGLEECYLCKW